MRFIFSSSYANRFFKKGKMLLFLFSLYLIQSFIVDDNLPNCRVALQLLANKIMLRLNIANKEKMYRIRHQKVGFSLKIPTWHDSYQNLGNDDNDLLTTCPLRWVN